MAKNKNLIIALIVVSFILLVASVIFYIDQTREARRIDPLEIEDMSKEEIIQFIYERQAKESTPFYYFIPIFAFFGLVVGALIYYMLYGDIEKKNQLIRYNTDVVLRLLDPEERKIIKKIVDDGGKLHQSEITYMEGYTKVKAHRIIESLAEKGIVQKEKLGKMRLIRMNREFYELLKEK